MRAQRGVALIVALFILLPLTLIAVVVMQSSGQDLKMAGSAASLSQAEHQLEGAIEAAMQINTLSSDIAGMVSGAVMSIPVSNIPRDVSVTSRDDDRVCKRRFDASSQNVIPACKYVEMQAELNYGKHARQMDWTVGVEQPLLTK